MKRTIKLFNQNETGIITMSKDDMTYKLRTFKMVYKLKFYSTSAYSDTPAICNTHCSICVTTQVGINTAYIKVCLSIL